MSTSRSPDLNGNGMVDPQDFQTFLNWFHDGDMRADWNGDGKLNVLDYAAFQNSAANFTPVTEPGWTQLPVASDARVLHVDPSKSDANSGLAESSAKATIPAALELCRPNSADRVRLKPGASWPGFHVNLSGRSKAEPLVIEPYNYEGPRPTILVEGHKAGVTSASSYLAFLGLRIVPVPGLVVDDRAGVIPYGMVFVTGAAPMWDNLIEGCEIVGLFKGVVVDDNGWGTAGPFSLRRNVIAGCYNAGPAHTAGVYIGGLGDSLLLLEENVFDHNGWSPEVGAVPNIFRRNLYVQSNCTNVVNRGNVYARSAAEGFQQRGGGLVEDNLCLANPIGVYASGAARVLRNVVMDSRDIDAATPRGTGIDAGNLTAGEVRGNLCAWRTTPSSDGRLLGMATPVGLTGPFTMSGNLVHEWTAGGAGVAYAMGSAHPFFGNWATMSGGAAYGLWRPGVWPAGLCHGNGATPNAKVWLEYAARSGTPEDWRAATGESLTQAVRPNGTGPRTIGEYAASIGLEPTLEAYLSAARGLRRGNWRADLTAAAVNAAIRTGFAFGAAP